jgi:hypothetical protein
MINHADHVLIMKEKVRIDEVAVEEVLNSILNKDLIESLLILTEEINLNQLDVVSEEHVECVEIQEGSEVDLKNLVEQEEVSEVDLKNLVVEEGVLGVDLKKLVAEEEGMIEENFLFVKVMKDMSPDKEVDSVEMRIGANSLMTEKIDVKNSKLLNQQMLVEV